ncbi:MAG: tRNA(Met) cytidine acetyltransferase, partial [Myxococcales bacterium]|nr:tRNA(Met) cytidine acetyltransferase [Myxococcales bacterium]
MPTPAHRRLILLRGAPRETQTAAQVLLTGLPAEGVLWVGGDHPQALPVAQVRRRLGESHDAVVLDGHGGLDPDALGRCHGFVRGGGALVVCLPPQGELPQGWQPRLVVPPYTVADVGDRTQRRLAAVLAKHAGPATAGAPPDRTTRGTAEQAQVVAALRQAWAQASPTLTALVADRGRGKSSALGLALQGQDPAKVMVCGPQREAVAEVLRFAGRPLPFATPDELILGDRRPRIIVVDEAAQVPVPALQRLVHAHPQAHLAFATTTHGYEGTGRGFVLRFLRWLADQGRPVARLSLSEPIRWAAGDPLEAAVFDALLLDAEPAPVTGTVDPAACTHEVLDRAALAANERDLRDFFGILVHAHYRTTPGDLQRMLDAPNLRMHALRHNGRIVAASWVALEGGLGPDWVDTVYWGRAGVRGHALPETLVCHGGHREAAALRIVRSVRIAA